MYNKINYKYQVCEEKIFLTILFLLKSINDKTLCGHFDVIETFSNKKKSTENLWCFDWNNKTV